MKTTFADHLKYRFQNTLSKGTPALLGLLGIISLVFIIITTVLVKVTVDGSGIPVIEIIWMSLMRTLDPGTMGGDEGSWPFLLSMLFISVIGIFVLSVLIGIITTGIESSIVSLRKGRSNVLEKNHTVILGWNGKIFSILYELIISNNQYKSKYTIVILAKKDKMDMEDTIREKLGSTGNTKVICRSGNTTETTDLKIINPKSAKSIIILPPEGTYADISIIKTILALFSIIDNDNGSLHIVTEARYQENCDLINMVGQNQVEVVLSNDIISKVIAQTCRQPGLSVVYSELLSFNGKFHYKDIKGPWYKDSSGDEIYFHLEKQLADHTYFDAVIGYPSASVLGIFTENDEVLVNPNMNYIIKPTDKIICIAEDREKIQYVSNSDYEIDSDIIVNETLNREKEHILIINCNRYTSTVIKELDNYIMPGSRITVLTMGKNHETIKTVDLKNCQIDLVEGDPTNRAILENIGIHKYENIIVLADLDNFIEEQADSRTLITLLHLRDICVNKKYYPTIISQILDEKNRQAALHSKADDFVVSEKLVGQCLTQISENKHLYTLFMELFSAEGTEIYFRPIANYINIDNEINVYTLIKAASMKGETVIGYKINRLFNEPKSNYGINLNPDKHKKVKFSSDDKLIVLASISYGKIQD
jgi:Trk K+ transport system NAD-binding subunit